MNTKARIPHNLKDEPEVEPEGQESYIVTEGKKRGATRDVRTEAAYDRYYTVLRVHAATRSSLTTGIPTKCSTMRVIISKASPSPCARWRPGAR